MKSPCALVPFCGQGLSLSSLASGHRPLVMCLIAAINSAIAGQAEHEETGVHGESPARCLGFCVIRPVFRRRGAGLCGRRLVLRIGQPFFRVRGPDLRARKPCWCKTRADLGPVQVHLCKAKAFFRGRNACLGESPAGIRSTKAHFCATRAVSRAPGVGASGPRFEFRPVRLQ